jgi:glycosyltransferase involved in cell wall biosynthesis
MEPKLPLVTIGIPTYNQAHYIEAAIESALTQTFTNLEVIVSDDCSTDNTQKIIEKYLTNKRFKYFRNDKNIRRVANYRKLFYELAAGDWYVNLDGDDYFTDNEFISVGIDRINYFKQKGHEVMFYHSALQAEINNRIVSYIPNINQEFKLLSGKEYFNGFFTLNASSHLTIICNRIKALTINYYSKDTLFTDVHSFVRLAVHGDVILDKRISAMWRHHNNNASHTLEKWLKEELEAKKDICHYAASFVGKKNAVQWFKKAKREMMHNLVYKNIKYDSVHYKDWLRYFKYFRLSPFFIKHFFKYLVLSIKPVRSLHIL